MGGGGGIIRELEGVERGREGGRRVAHASTTHLSSWHTHMSGTACSVPWTAVTKETQVDTSSTHCP